MPKGRLTRRKKFEKFFRRMPKQWTDIETLSQQAGRLAAYLKEKQGLVEHRLVQKRKCKGILIITGEWRKL